MQPTESGNQPERIRGVERSLEIQLGGLGGLEVRPTRFFVWTGDERAGHERVLSLGSQPRSLDRERRPRETTAGALRVRALGNPLMTLALAGVHAAKTLRRAAR